jgi:hypothetical protein
MATVFLLLVAIFEIRLSFLSFNTKVIGPGQNFLYNLKKFLFNSQSFSNWFKLE